MGNKTRIKRYVSASIGEESEASHELYLIAIKVHILIRKGLLGGGGKSRQAANKRLEGLTYP